MNKALKKRSVGSARTTVLMFLFLLASLLLLQPASGFSQCEVTVDVIGLLQNAAGQPIANQELKMCFYVSPDKRDVEVLTTTDSQGRFRFREVVPLNAYNNAGYWCVEIQGRLYVSGSQGTNQNTDTFGYAPGSPAAASETGAYENWAVQGTYQDNVLLFHSIREESSQGEESGFADMSVQLGSEEEPCRITIGGAAGGTVLTVKHINAETGLAVASPESHSDVAGRPAVMTKAREIAGMAVLRVESGNQLKAEAERGSPITGYPVELPSASETAGGNVELIYYYHRDRDRDGVPDYEVTSRYVGKDGAKLSGYPEITELYAHKDSYEGRAPVVSGYTYVGYENDDEELLPGTPVLIVAADADFQYVYEKVPSGGAGGSSGKTDEEPPPDLPVLTEPPEGAGEEELPPEDDGAEAIEEDDPPDLDDVFVPEPLQSGGASQGAAAEAAPEQLSPAEVQEPEQRSVTFVKMSYQQQASPGEQITYSFAGFANEQDHPLEEFTLADEPDPGLDLISVNLPAFAQGAEVAYDILYSTNRKTEIGLIHDQPADIPLYAEIPALPKGENITELSIHFGTVPPGFAAGDQLEMTFQVWEDPPKEELHNLGFLYYEDQGEKISVRSGNGPAAVSIREERNDRSPKQAPVTAPMAERQDNLIHGGRRSLAKATAVVLLLLLLVFVTGRHVWKQSK